MNQMFLKRLKKLIPFAPGKCRASTSCDKMHLLPFKPKYGIGPCGNILILNNRSSTANNFSTNGLNSESIEKSSERGKTQINWCIRELDKETLLKNVNLEEDSNNDGLNVLNYITGLREISPDLRVAAANLHFSKMRSDGVAITKSHYCGLLKCYLKCKYFGDLQDFLMTMESDGVKVSKDVKVLIVKCLAEAGRGRQIPEIIEEYDEECFTLEEEADYYSSIIYSSGLSGDFSGALETFEKLEKKKFNLMNPIYTSLIRLFVIKGDVSGLEKLYKEIAENKIYFSIDEIYSILKELALTQHFHLLEKIPDLHQDKSLLKIGSELIIELVYKNEIESAFGLATTLLGFNYGKPDIDLINYKNNMYKSLIGTLIYLDYPAIDLLKKCNELRRSNDSLPVYEFALCNYLKKGDMSKSLMTLRKMLKEDICIKPFYFWPLIILAKIKYGDDGIVQILRNMHEMHVLINEETLVTYVFPNISNLSFASKILDRVTFLNTQSHFIQEVFVKYTLSNRLFNQCLNFLQKKPLTTGRSYENLKDLCIKTLINIPDEKDVYAILKMLGDFDLIELLDRLTCVKDTQTISTIMKNVKKHKFPLRNKKGGVETLEKIIKSCDLVINIEDLIDNSRSTSIFKKVDEEERECASSKYEVIKKWEERESFMGQLLARKSIVKSIGLKLIRSYVTEMFFERAIRLRNKLYEIYGPKMDLTPAIFLDFAKMSAYENDVETAMRLFSKVMTTDEKFVLNNPAILSFARCLIEKGNFDEMYQVLSQTLDKKSYCLRTRSCVLLLRNVALLGDPYKTNKVYQLFLERNLILPSANTLQVFVSTYVQARDMDGAVKQFFKTSNAGAMVNKALLLKALARERRYDLFDSVVKFLSDHLEAELVDSLTLTAIAEAGDESALYNYYRELSLKLNEKHHIGRLFNYGLTLTACKAFIRLAKRTSQPYYNYVAMATNTIYKDGDYEECEKFLEFCANWKIKVGSQRMRDLRNFKNLGEMLKASLVETAGPETQRDAGRSLSVDETAGK